MPAMDAEAGNFGLEIGILALRDRRPQDWIDHDPAAGVHGRCAETAARMRGFRPQVAVELRRNWPTDRTCVRVRERVGRNTGVRTTHGPPEPRLCGALVRGGPGPCPAWLISQFRITTGWAMGACSQLGGAVALASASWRARLASSASLLRRRSSRRDSSDASSLLCATCLRDAPPLTIKRWRKTYASSGSTRNEATGSGLNDRYALSASLDMALTAVPYAWTA